MQVKAKGTELRRMLAVRNLTIQAFAQAVGVSETQAAEWITGRSGVSPANRQRVQEALGCAFEDVFEIADEASA